MYNLRSCFTCGYLQVVFVESSSSRIHVPHFTCKCSHASLVFKRFFLSTNYTKQTVLAEQSRSTCFELLAVFSLSSSKLSLPMDKHLLNNQSRYIQTHCCKNLRMRPLISSELKQLPCKTKIIIIVIIIIFFNNNWVTVWKFSNRKLLNSVEQWLLVHCAQNTLQGGMVVGVSTSNPMGGGRSWPSWITNKPKIIMEETVLGHHTSLLKQYEAQRQTWGTKTLLWLFWVCLWPTSLRSRGNLCRTALGQWQQSKL